MLPRFSEWKAIVEHSVVNSGGLILEVNTRVGSLLKSEGVRHELSIPKTPQQMG